jgi:hypothetical protein
MFLFLLLLINRQHILGKWLAPLLWKTTIGKAGCFHKDTISPMQSSFLPAARRLQAGSSGAGCCRCCCCCCSWRAALAAVAGAQMESNERQEQLIADTLWVEQTVRFQLGRNEEACDCWPDMAGRLPEGRKWNDGLAAAASNGRELARVPGWTPKALAVPATSGAAGDLPLASREAWKRHAHAARRLQRAGAPSAGTRRADGLPRAAAARQPPTGSLVATYHLPASSTSWCRGGSRRITRSC